jgi:putative transposase
MRELDFSKANLSLDLAEVKGMFAMHLQEGCRRVFKQTLEGLMAHDLYEHLQAGRNERTAARTGYRNGFRRRSLLTNFGELELAVPRDRGGEFKPKYFARYKRVDKAVDSGIKAMFLRGVSTRKVGEVLEALCGRGVSAGYVSTVTKDLDELVKTFHNGAIADDYAFLFIDGLGVRIRYELQVKRMIVLVAYGIKTSGQRCFIGFWVAKSESQANYLYFLQNLKTRGLKGQNLRLIIMDGALGLWSAIEEVYPHVPHQLCWVHKLRNVSRYCPKRYRQACVGEAAKIMYAQTPGKAAKIYRAWRARWKAEIPRAVNCLEKDFDRLIPCLAFPLNLQKIIRTTNVIERSFREVRRRLKVMGYFQNSRSANRIVAALFEYDNIKWRKKTNYITQLALYLENVA